MRPFDGPATGLPLAVPETPPALEHAVAGAGLLTLRRLRPPPQVRVELDRGRPARVRSLEWRRLPRLGAVRQSAGPWRSSGDWWRPGAATMPRAAATPSVWQPDPSVWSDEPATGWDEDEWDVVLESGTALRLARDRRRDAWVVAALID